MIGGRFSGWKSFEFGSINDENVWPTVVVKVKNRYSCTGGLNDVFLGVLASENIHHRETRILRDVCKVRQRLGWLRMLSGTVPSGNERKGQQGEKSSQERGNRSAMRRIS
jgi:hypothetical protein